MNDDAARIARMYPSMAQSQATKESVAASPPQLDTAAPAEAPPRVADGFDQTHPADMAARRYPALEQPDPVAQEIADKAKGEQAVELVENIPDSVKALREAEPAGLRHEALYDQALGIRTKDLLSGQLPPEHVFARNVVSGMAADCGIAPDDLQTIVNEVNAAHRGVQPDGKVSETDRADAAALYNRDPRIGVVLNSLNVVNRPRVVAILAAAAREQRARGRL